jgi:hypothetical protein
MQGNVVFCDDVRVEASGKHTLVGVYPNGMGVPGNFPASVRVVVWLHMTGVPAGRHKVDFFLRGPEAPLPHVHNAGEVEIEAPWLPVAFFMGPFDIPVAAPGDIVALVSVDNGQMQQVGALNVAPLVR